MIHIVMYHSRLDRPQSRKSLEQSSPLEEWYLKMEQELAGQGNKSNKEIDFLIGK